MKRSIFLMLLSIFISKFTFSQNNLCNSSFLFCTDTTNIYPAGVNAGSAQTGPDYTCLYTQPNPAWYYMEVLNSGPIIIYLSSTPNVDIDFTCWGPFTNQVTPCQSQLTAATTVDCSYSTSWNETVDIPNAQTGQVYILLITNYSNIPCNISFVQTNSDSVGSGSSYCESANNNLCVGDTIKLTAQQGPTGCTYYWTGPDGFSSTQQNPVIPSTTLAMSGIYYYQFILGVDTSNAVPDIIVVKPTPSSSFNISMDSACAHVPIQLIYTGTAMYNATYNWDVDGGTPSSITGQGPFYISWSDTGLVNISLTVSENGCTSPITILPVYVNPIPTSSFTVVSPVCHDSISTITYTGNASANATYTWNFNGGTIISGSGMGPYQVSWHDIGMHQIILLVHENGCQSLTTIVPVVVTQFAGISSIVATNPIAIFPNPNPGIFTLDGLGTAFIYNILGECISNKEVIGTTSFNLTGHASGIYIVRFVDMQNNSTIQKLVLQ